MKHQHMLKYFISGICLLLVSFSTLAQDETVEQDSIKYQNKYGLRLGFDLGKLVRTLADNDYSGFEITGDYRLTSNLYLATELGNEEKKTETEFLKSSAQGSYIKAGIDYNMYQNWYGMDNLIFAGLRVGYSTFEQTLDEYTIYDTNNAAWGQYTVSEGQEFTGLNATWIELIFGIKVETFNNLYLGINMQLKSRMTETEPDNFENLYIPGIGRTYDSGSFGVVFGYNISYLIPLYKKDK